MSIQQLDQRNLTIAARAALRGIGRVEPNPLVGCVIGNDKGHISAIAHHASFGNPHAEINAIARCRAQGIDPAGKTVWVTLEPCSHTGKTPPCTDALIAAAIARVIYAVDDPNPEAKGGANRLRDAGITVEHVHNQSSRTIALPFLTRQHLGRPWVIGKWAQTLDGTIATPTNQPQWISNEVSRRHVHRTRACVDAILTGIGTVLADDPLLTVRDVATRRLPIRVVVDAALQTPTDCYLVTTISHAPLIIACNKSMSKSDKASLLSNAGATILPVELEGDRLDLVNLLQTLWKEHRIATILTECGPRLMQSLANASLLDMLQVYIAPHTLSDAHPPGTPAELSNEMLSDTTSFTLLNARNKAGDQLRTYMSSSHLATD